MASKKLPRRLSKLKKILDKQGWTQDFTSRGHPRFTPPPDLKNDNGQVAYPVVFSKTPSDHRSDKNSISDLRKAGAKIPNNFKTN